MQTRPREETRVIHHLALRLADVETFLPKIEVVRRHARRRIVFLEPLFPSYLFTRFRIDPRTWQAVRWAPGVRRMLGEDGQPAEVSPDLITTIQQRIEPLGFVRIGMQIKAGDRVRVKGGSFAGLEGIFERPTTRRDRVRVLLEILGRVTPLELDVFELERVSP